MSINDSAKTSNKSFAARNSLPPHYGRRWIALCTGLFIMAMGVGLSIKSNLGTSPISSLPYVLSLISPLTVGTATIAMHVVLILLQILILRKNYQPIQLLQLPVAIIFGYLCDFWVWVFQDLSCSGYLQQWLCCIAGIIFVAAGVSFEVVSRAVTLAGEGFVLTVCKVAPIKFSNMKVIFDVSLVVIAAAISLTVMGTLKGVREGTIAAAICVGLLSRQMQKPLLRLEQKYLI